MGTLHTIKVVRDNDRGWQIINQSKFDADPDAYKAYVEEAEEEEVVLSRAEVKAALDLLGVEYKGNAPTVKLLALLRAQTDED